MATVTTNNDGKILGGYLKEKLTIALTRINDDELTRAVTKVCSHKLKIPNEKHMQRLLQASFGSYAHADNSKGDVSRWIVDNLEEHLHAHNWVVVLKTQLAFHRLMQDGSDDINIRIQSRRNLFAVSRTKDLADSPDGAVQSIFVQQYMRYLEERAIAQDSVRLGVRLENRAFGDTLLGLEPRKAVQATAAFLLQFEVAADVQFFEEAVNNYATLLGHQNVLNDAKLLFVALSRSILRVVQMAPALSADERDTWRPLIKRYNAITGKFVAKLEKMRSSRVSWGEQLPALQVLPADAIASVLAALDGAPAPSPASPMGSPDAMPTVKLSDLMKRAGAAGASAGTMSSTMSMPEDEDAELAAAIRASLEEQEQRQKQEELLRKYNGTANPAEAAAAAAAASATSPSIAAPAPASAPAPAAVAPPAPAPKKTGLDDLFGPTSSPPPAAAPLYGASVPSTSASASVDLFGNAVPRPGAVPAVSGSVDLFAPKPSVVSPPPAAPIAAPATDLFAAPAHAPAAAPATDVFATFSAPAPAPVANAPAPAAPAAPPKPADPFAGAFANVAVASPAFSTASSSSAGVVAPAGSAAAAAPATSQPSLFGAAAPASTTSASAPAPAAATPYPDLFGNAKQRDDTFQATLDFFAPPSSQPAPAPKQETFDPFGNTDANGRQRAW